MKTLLAVFLLAILAVISASEFRVNKCALCKLGCTFFKKESEKEKCTLACGVILCEDEKPTTSVIEAQNTEEADILRRGYDDDEEDEEADLPNPFLAGAKLGWDIYWQHIYPRQTGKESPFHDDEVEEESDLPNPFLAGAKLGWDIYWQHIYPRQTGKQSPFHDDEAEEESDLPNPIFAGAKLGWDIYWKHIYPRQTGKESPFHDDDFEEESDSFASDCGEAYEKGRLIGRKQCVSIDGKPVVTSTAEAFNKMKRAAASAGVSLHLNSGFRTQAEQKRLYNCYLTKKCNNGNLAAKPGYSNHQNGLALDINVTSSKTYNWLVNNASKFGFVRTVPSEKWHWELRHSRCNAFVKYSCK